MCVHICLYSCKIQLYNLCTHPIIKMVKHRYVEHTSDIESLLALFPGSSPPHTHIVRYTTKNWGEPENVAVHISQRCVVF